MDGWNTSFLLGWPIFRCYVSFREGNLRVEVFSGNVRFPPALPNIAGENGPRMKMYLRNEKKIRLAMLVYQRVHISGWLHICGCYFSH